MKILLVNNISLSFDKFNEQNKLLMQSAKEINIDLEIMNNARLTSELAKNENIVKKFKAILFYDKDIFLCKKLENLGCKVLNCSDCIKNCDNKALTYQILENHNIPIPKTYIVPFLFYYKKKYLNEFVETIISKLSLPLVAKKWFGSEGQQVYLLHTKNEIFKLIKKEKGKELLFQQYYSECHGSDIRINVVGNEVVACMHRKSSTNDFRSNLSNGGFAKTYSPSDKEIEIAKLSAKALNCDFCGVDILQTKNGPVVCEVNSNAHLLNIYKVTTINVAKKILDYIVNYIN